MKDIIDKLEPLRNQKLSKEERVSLYARINSSIKSPTHIPSPFLQTGTFTMVRRHASIFSRFALVASIIVVIGGGSATFASAKALPGDTLYPIKISSEKIAISITKSSEKKLNLQTQHIENRLDEAKGLLEKNEVSKEAEAILSENLEANVKDMTATIKTLQEDGDVEAIIKNTNELAPILKSHKKVLNEVKEKAKEDRETEKTEKLEKVEKTEPKTTPEETQINPSDSEIEITTSETIIETTQTEIPESGTPVTETNLLVEEVVLDEVTVASSLTDSLIETISETIIVVEQAENDALMQVSEAVSSGSDIDDEIVKEAVDSITDKAETKIEAIKQTEILTQPHSSDTSIPDTKLSTEIPDDNLTIEDAEAYLTLSRTAYNEKRFEDALMYSQKASDILNLIAPQETLLELQTKERLNLEATAKKSIDNIKNIIEKIAPVSTSLPQ